LRMWCLCAVSYMHDLLTENLDPGLKLC